MGKELPTGKTKKNRATPGSSASGELSRVMKLAALLQQQLRAMTQTVKKLKHEKARLELEVQRRDSEIRQLRTELQRLSRGRNNGPDFGDF